MEGNKRDMLTIDLIGAVIGRLEKDEFINDITIEDFMTSMLEVTTIIASEYSGTDMTIIDASHTLNRIAVNETIRIEEYMREDAKEAGMKTTESLSKD